MSMIAAERGNGGTAAEPAGSFTHIACLRPICVECEAVYEDGEYGWIVCFPTLSEAVRALAASGWLITEETLLCPCCVRAAGLDAAGQVERSACARCQPALFGGEQPPDDCLCGRGEARIVTTVFVSRAHPGFHSRQCVTARCVDCGNGWRDDGDPEGGWHYLSVAEAAKELAEMEWTVEGGAAVCARCTDLRTCAREGHAWKPAPYVSRDGIRRDYCPRCYKRREPGMSA
jgi:hypothetical protein